ncbi:ferredoxin [Mycolicibacterium murale]|uniref:Ferredoxin n=1 Tax=Mycolicibacterium murale TaxID=182220 RepID=A0A7I9WGN3_9MYCO|nr:ferredoxin [Mycolicibacterium murale]MCV7180641.1 ferredoxin [Mycolicibacterium murale]GFG56863.1 ferredoxin [Mycolicibacterium murale]
MKVSVDRSLCDEHGQCTIAAPAVFTLTDSGLQFVAEPDESLRGAVDDAADVCPLQAITVES